MTTAFPITLPRPLRAGYGYQVSQPHAEQPNDRGLGRRRRLGIGNSTSMTLVWRFTEAEFQAFAQWWRDDITYGTANFEIQLLNGYSDVAQDVRPVGAYSAQNLVGAWEVALQVELVAAPVASSATLTEAIANYADLTQARALHTLVHVSIPHYFDPITFP